MSNPLILKDNINRKVSSRTSLKKEIIKEEKGRKHVFVSCHMISNSNTAFNHIKIWNKHLIWLAFDLDILQMPSLSAGKLTLIESLSFKIWNLWKQLALPIISCFPNMHIFVCFFLQSQALLWPLLPLNRFIYGTDKLVCSSSALCSIFCMHCFPLIISLNT